MALVAATTRSGIRCHLPPASWLPNLRVRSFPPSGVCYSVFYEVTWAGSSRGGSSERALDGMESAVTTSSPRIVLAEGSQSNRIAIELLDAREDAKDDHDSLACSGDARTSWGVRRLREQDHEAVGQGERRTSPNQSTSTLTKINRGHPQVVLESCVQLLATNVPYLFAHHVCDVLNLNSGLCQFSVVGRLV